MSSWLAVTLCRLWFWTDGCRIPTLSRSAYLGSSDWPLFSLEGGAGLKLMITFKVCYLSMAGLVTWKIQSLAALYSSRVVLCLATQCRIFPVYPQPLTFPSVGCGLPPFCLPSALFLLFFFFFSRCMASLWCLHLLLVRTCTTLLKPSVSTLHRLLLH